MSPAPARLLLALGASLLVAACSGQVAPSAPTRPTTAPGTGSPAAIAPTATPPLLPSTAPAPPVATPFPCATYGLTCQTFPVETTLGVPFTPPVPCGPIGAGATIPGAATPAPGETVATCQVQLDVYAPSGGSRRPTVVLIPGGPLPLGQRTYLGSFAQLIAGQGALVFAADYRSGPEYGGGSPRTFQDVACAIRFARATAPRYGGDPGRVVLAAHSFGGFPAAVVTLSPTEVALDAASCLAPTGSGRPDAFVGIDAIYSLDAILPDFLDRFFGGPRTDRPDEWNAGDPSVLLSQPGTPAVPIRLVQGARDMTVRPEASLAFQARLREAGHDVTLTTIEDADHTRVLSHPATVAAVLAATGS